MLKRLSLRKIALTSAALFALALIYLIPGNEPKLEATSDLEYVDSSVTTNPIFLMDKSSYVALTDVPVSGTSVEEKARELLKNTFWFLSITLAICVCGGIMLKNEIIFILFERGNFLRQDTLITANVFALYLLGLLPFGLAKIFSLWLYAHKKQGKAAKISAISLGTSFIISVILMQFFALYGLALASSIGGFVLFALTIKQFGLKDFKAILLFKKAWFILIGILAIEIIILKIFLMFYSL